jgi:hypothetical protein
MTFKRFGGVVLCGVIAAVSLAVGSSPAFGSTDRVHPPHPSQPVLPPPSGGSVPPGESNGNSHRPV